VDPRAGLDHVERLKFLTITGLELQPLGRPARIQSLYRLRYRGSSDYRSEAKFEQKSHLTLVMPYCNLLMKQEQLQ
jgi:hypothetical protein